jgi:hypothetical protein
VTVTQDGRDSGEIPGFLDIVLEIHNNDHTQIQNWAGKIPVEKKSHLREPRSNPAFGGSTQFGKKVTVLKDRSHLSCYRIGGKSDEKI